MHTTLEIKGGKVYAAIHDESYKATIIRPIGLLPEFMTTSPIAPPGRGGKDWQWAWVWGKWVKSYK